MDSLARDADILKAAEDWKAAGRGVALATVVETWGSAPRPVGSNLVIDDQGNFLGCVSGGCVEGAVVTEAMDVIESGKPKTLEFGVADETAWKVGTVLRRHHPGVRRKGGLMPHTPLIPAQAGDPVLSVLLGSRRPRFRGDDRTHRSCASTSSKP